MKNEMSQEIYNQFHDFLFKLMTFFGFVPEMPSAKMPIAEMPSAEMPSAEMPSAEMPIVLFICRRF